MAAPTNQQLLIAIAALARTLMLPSPTSNQTGIGALPSNQLAIPINTNNPQGVYNQQLGNNLVISADANYIYINQNVGDPSLG